MKKNELVYLHCVSGNTVCPVCRVIFKSDEKKHEGNAIGEFGDSPIDVTLAALCNATGAKSAKPVISINGGAPKYKIIVEKDGQFKEGESEGLDFYVEIGNAFANALNKF